MFGLKKKTECDRVSDRLSGYVDGQLSGKTLQKVELHLSEYEACAQQLDELRTTVEILRDVEQVAAPRSFVIDPAMVAKHERPHLYGERVLRLLRPALAAASFVFVVMLSIGIFIPPGGGLLSRGNAFTLGSGINWLLIGTWVLGVVAVVLVCVIFFIIWKRNRLDI